MDTDTGPSAYSRAVGVILTAKQKRRGTTVAFLVKQTGISRSTIQRMLDGKREITLGTLTAVCDALELDPGAVLDEARRDLGKHVNG